MNSSLLTFVWWSYPQRNAPLSMPRLKLNIFRTFPSSICCEVENHQAQTSMPFQILPTTICLSYTNGIQTQSLQCVCLSHHFVVHAIGINDDGKEGGVQNFFVHGLVSSSYNRYRCLIIHQFNKRPQNPNVGLHLFIRQQCASEYRTFPMILDAYQNQKQFYISICSIHCVDDQNISKPCIIRLQSSITPK